MAEKRNDLEEKTLSAPAAVVTDMRPRFLWIQTPAGMLRIRRMASPQLFTQIQNFQNLRLLTEAGEWVAAGDAGQLEEVSKFLQRCLVNQDEDTLALPGRKGLQVILTWSAERRRQIAASAAQFMEV